jgi:hypothetical protein
MTEATYLPSRNATMQPSFAPFDGFDPFDKLRADMLTASRLRATEVTAGFLEHRTFNIQHSTFKS